MRPAATAPRTLAEWIEADGVSLHASLSDTRPGADEWTPGTRHWRVRLIRHAGPQGHRFLTCWYSMGPALAGPPTAAAVLDALLMDAGTVDEYEDAYELAYEHGMTDSPAAMRRAVATWAQLTREAGRLRVWLGSDFERVAELERDA